MARMNCPAPVEVTRKNMRFLLPCNPATATLNKLIEELKKCGVIITRVCEVTYDTTLVEKGRYPGSRRAFWRWCATGQADRW